MASLPLFGVEASLPPQLAGLDREFVKVYDDPRLGVSIRYGSADGVKADVYLYDLGLPAIPADLEAPEVVAWFREACQNVLTHGDQGTYLDLAVRASQYLHLPADAPTPLCLWAMFTYRQKPDLGVTFTGPRVSHLALRTDRGFVNKVRFTYPADHGEAGFHGFLGFLTTWIATVQSQGTAG